MKNKIDRRYLKICLYIVVTAIAIYFAFMMINAIPNIYKGAISIIKIIAGLLKPLIIGLIFAYILHAPSKGIERFLANRKRVKIKNPKARRALGIVISYLGVFAVIIGLIWGIYFMIGGQLSKTTSLSNIVDYISQYFGENNFNEKSIKEAILSLNIPFINEIEQYISDVVVYIQKFITSLFSNSFSSIINLGSNIFSILVAFVLSIYLLYDSDYFKLLWRKFFYLILRDTRASKLVKNALSVINETFSSYIRGQLIEALLVALLSTIALLIVGVDYALIIGIISGLFNLVPYLGPIVGTLIAGIVALLGGSYWTVFWTIVSMIIVQQLDSNIFQPRVVGHNVGLHPLFIMIAIIIGGSRGGILGMLVAVPIAASIKKLLSTWYRNRYEESFRKSDAIYKESIEDEIKDKCE